ncbi:hypothetical protein FACS1894204_03790 [Synergistales bacterium]|nr:hypothetical protein FACS1894204_03790 [Synergistales bacterium]
MEKRIIAVIKWLERSLKSCRDGQVEKAMMDVECARADMERLRSEVWTNLSRRASRKKSWHGVVVCFLGLLFVLSLVTPLSPDSLTRAPQDEDAQIVVLQGEEPQQSAKKSKPVIAAQMTAKPKAAQGSGKMSSEAEISFERVASLLQTGERALKNGSPIIRIER